MANDPVNEVVQPLIEMVGQVLRTINQLAICLEQNRLLPKDHPVFAQIDDLSQRLDNTTTESLAQHSREIAAARAAAERAAKAFVPERCPSCGHLFREPLES